MTLNERLGRIKSTTRKSTDSDKTMRMQYVIQEHKSKSRHWDFRLQMGTKMWSWSIPKGPSLNPGESRLAIETTPHELSYNNFEGVIEKGLYGAGKVLQWDKGTYAIIDGNEADALVGLKRGVLRFELFGEKLRGKWALIKTNRDWLLVKMNDKYASKEDNIVKSRPESVKSGKMMMEISEIDGLITKHKELGRS